MAARFVSKQAQRGFTLIEIMIVVVIGTILAAIAVPSYRDYMTQSKLGEAHAQLSSMRVKLEQYFLDNRTYVGACAANTVAPVPAAPDVRYFTYTCPTLTGTTYVVQAAGVAAQGTGGFAYTVNEQNVRATTAVPSGWTANATCWVTRKGGSC